MIVIGLTGGIASGKSVVSGFLSEFGAVVIDADKLGHQVYLPGTDGHREVVEAFGQGIVAEDGTIDRRKLAPIVFGNPDKLAQLNSIAWPKIKALARERLAELREQGTDVVVLEAAILFEAGWEDLCDEIWTVQVDREGAIARLMERNGMDREAALARINNQMSNEARAERATIVIRNEGTLEELRTLLESNWHGLKARIAALTAG